MELSNCSLEYDEYTKCKQDPVYFASKYLKLKHSTGIKPIILHDYQLAFVKYITSLKGK